MKKIKIFLLSLLFFVAASTLAFKDDLFQVSKNVDVFVALFKEISINYVDETKAADLIKHGIDGMLGSLDPYTEYVPPSEIENYKLKYISTHYGGIGVATLSIEGHLYVNEILEGYPAHKVDMRAGDEIVQINRVAVKGKERAELSQMIRGPRGTAVDLEIKRGNEYLKKTLVREEIKQANVSYHAMLDQQIGYIKLDKFLENSGLEMRNALKEILKHQPQGLILDLRNNGGGILQEAVKILGLFVPNQTLVVSQKGRNPQKNIQYRTNTMPLAPDLPLVILINGASASASEIVAGTLQDLDRAVIVGQQSFGKGLVQQTFNLPYNSLVKVTVAKYYTASGRCIQALDYAHRNAKGMAQKMADSSRTAYLTTKGRTVFDGNGIAPDLTTPTNQMADITRTLSNKGLFFAFANRYRDKHPNIGWAKKFRLSDSDYQQFVTSLDSKALQYNTKADLLLASLSDMTHTQRDLAPVKTDIDKIKLRVEQEKKNDLTTYKDEIKRLLETQIVSRYYFDKGKIEQAFQYDTEVNKAIELLNKPNQVLAILRGDGAYKTIGNKTQNTIGSRN